jgi:hypothetical protein
VTPLRLAHVLCATVCGALGLVVGCGGRTGLPGDGLAGLEPLDAGADVVVGVGVDASVDASFDVTVDVSPDEGVDSGQELDEGADAADSATDGLAPGQCPPTYPVAGPCDDNGQECNYPGGPCVCTTGCMEGQCCPLTCADLGYPCGMVGDGCGSILQCRTCDPGQSCMSPGICFPKSAGCTPRSCTASSCGYIDDGCGGQIDCGSCYWSCIASGP